MSHAVFLIHCPDQIGLVSRISGFFFDRGFNILNCQQYTDEAETLYYMRLQLDLATLTTSRRELEAEFAAFGEPLKLSWQVSYSDRVPRMAILCTRESHCLYDLVLRQREGELACEIPVIISNHPDLESVADQFRIPYHCLPGGKDARAAREQALEDLLQRYHIDLIVMARYMQILSSDFCERHAGQVINIHHAMLPAFEGANPYRRAWERGVKVIGATAHYATADLDQGPIIAQDVEACSHEDSVADLRRRGRDIERIVLARAVKAHLDSRIIVRTNRTVVF